MIKSHSLLFSDFQTTWYRKWARELKQNKDNLDNHALYANKFWQNAIIFQALMERDVVGSGRKGLGFGVGQERLPSLFAKYGVHITATDQDFKTKKAGHWSKHELATGMQSLNRLGICNKEEFAECVEYMPVDMTKVPKSLHGQYDFLWSNCALGHLGSIPAGLGFIKESLVCLKTGGVAVHTTELNILSNNATVDSGSTVLFRLKDIYKLQNDLLSKGYLADPFVLTLGKSAEDQRISMRPEYGNDYSKIQVMGHLATQIILIIRKPTSLTKAMRLKARLRFKKTYLRNLATLQNYRKSDSVIKPILQSQKASIKKLKIAPKEKIIKVTVPAGKTKEVVLEFKNNSLVPLFGKYSRLGQNQPIALATSDPRDRSSVFAGELWREGKNRPSVDLWVAERNSAGLKSNYALADYLVPNQNFAFKIQLDATSLKKGSYNEEFSVVQENVGWIEGSQLTLEVKIT